MRSRSSSTSSHSSVDSIIEEFEERKKSFERPGRKTSAPERLNTSYEYREGVRKSQAEAARGKQRVKHFTYTGHRQSTNLYFLH